MTKRGILLLIILGVLIITASCVPLQPASNDSQNPSSPSSEQPPSTLVEQPSPPEPSSESSGKTDAPAEVPSPNVTEPSPQPPASPLTNTSPNRTNETTVTLSDVKTSNQSISEATIRIREDELLKLNVNYTDPDGDTVTLTFSKPLDKKGEWKTSYGDAGEYQSTIIAGDGKLSTTTRLKIIVERVNVPPVIEGVRDITVKEGEIIRFEPKVTDPNNDPVTVTISDPLKNGIFKTDHTNAGDYKIKITATDGELKTEKNFLLRVLDVNVKPSITDLPEKITVKEGELVRIKPAVTDLDGDKVKVTISDPVGDDGLWETKFTDHGQYIITIIADDGKDKVTKKIELTVQDQNAPPEITSVTLAR